MQLNRSKEAWQEIYRKVPSAPTDKGRIDLITIRPDLSIRKIKREVNLDLLLGVVGDNWSIRPSSRMPECSPHPDM